MNLRKLIFTENLCYKRNVQEYDIRYTTFQSRGPKGIMVHSTGANNPELRRYVAPDDGLLGENEYNNHWNQLMDRLVCVHAFIGKLKDGSIATYQTMPWNFRGWHAGGDANDTHISFEICEDDLKDATYFKKVYQEAVELCVYLCKEYGLTEKDIICHSEGHAKGIASNHDDVMHWFPKHGKSMDTFRADVKALLNKKEEPPKEPEKDPAQKPVTKGIEEGNVVTLTADAVYYNGKTIPDWVKADKWIVKSVSGDRVVIDKSVDGKHSIMSPVNAKYLNVFNTSTSSGATADKIDPNEKAECAESFATSKAGTYMVTANSGLNLRAGASMDKPILEVLVRGSIVTCYGYYTGEWLYVKAPSGAVGFCYGDYLAKV